MSDIDDLMGQIPIAQLAGKLGLSEQETDAAVRQALPALVGGLAANAEDPAGAASLSKAIGEHDDTLLDGGVDLDQVDAADGQKIVRNVFGDNEDAVVDKLGGLGNVNAGTIAKLLPLLAPLVMSFLAKRQAGSGSGDDDGGGSVASSAACSAGAGWVVSVGSSVVAVAAGVVAVAAGAWAICSAGSSAVASAEPASVTSRSPVFPVGGLATGRRGPSAGHWAKMATNGPWYARLWKDRPPIQGRVAAIGWILVGVVWTALALASSGSMPLRLMYVVLAVWAFFAAATIAATVRSRGSRDRPSPGSRLIPNPRSHGAARTGWATAPYRTS